MAALVRSPTRNADNMDVPTLDALRAFDLVGDGILFVDDERRAVAANQAAAGLLGIPHAEVCGRTVEELMPMSGDVHVDASWQMFLRRGKQDGTFLRVDADGSRRPVEYRARAHARPGEHLFVLRDLTALVGSEAKGGHGVDGSSNGASELALAKDALAVKTQLLEAVLRHAPVGILIAEAPTGRLVSMNHSFESLWKGHGPETPDVDAYGAWVLWNEDGSARSPQQTQLARALMGETCGPEVVRFRRWDGTEGVMRTTAAPVRDGMGRVVAAVAACQDITGEIELTTARRRLHEEVLAKTALLEAVVSHAPIGIVVSDRSGRFLSVNDRYTALFGSDVPEAKDAAVAQALRGETVTHKFQFRRSDGSARWVCLTAAPVHDESHRIVAAVALCEDISNDIELMQARDELLKEVVQERAKLKSLLTELPVAAVVFEPPDFRIELVNEAYLAIIGQRDVVGKTLAEIHPGVSAHSILHCLAKVCEEKKPQERREHALVLPGSEAEAAPRYFTNTFQPLFDEAGDVSRVVATVLEVTQEVRARTLVFEAAERLRVVLDEMPVGVNVLDAQSGEVLLSNKASSEILGFDVKDRSTPALWQVWRARHSNGRLLEPDEHAFRRVMLTRESVHNQVVLLQRAGSDGEIVVRSSAALIRGEGDHELVISVFQDISEEHKLFVEREQTARFAETFVGILAHDLRNPLNAISTAAFFLQRASSIDAKDMKRVRMIASSASRMAEMVTQLLDLTHGRLAGGIPIERKATDLVQVVGAVLDEIAMSHGAVTLHRDLPTTLEGMWDGDRLAQVVSNVVGNAVQHGDQARPIGVLLRDEGQTVVLKVHSHGSPIPKDLLPILFDPFRRGDQTATGKTRGLGLGLYITREIIVAHGGEVNVHSTTAEGTTFIIQLPRVPLDPGSKGNVGPRADV